MAKKSTKGTAGKGKSRARRGGKTRKAAPRPRCGLCGKTGKLTKTECCDQWICDDEDQYVMFSYAQNSCHRNHSRYTLCGSHDAEGHSGDWKDCPQCKDEIQPEMYAYFGTNEYNFEPLENPPDYEPTKCAKCGTVIVLSEGGYSISRGEHRCQKCSEAAFPGLVN